MKQDTFTINETIKPENLNLKRIKIQKREQSHRGIFEREKKKKQFWKFRDVKKIYIKFFEIEIPTLLGPDMNKSMY